MSSFSVWPRPLLVSAVSVLSSLAAPQLLSAAGASARSSDPRVLAIYKKEVHFFRERTFEHLGSVEIPRGWAQSWWLDEGGQRLGVLSREGLLKQKGRSAARCRR